jgi:transposase
VRYFGIDIGKEKHAVAGFEGDGAVALKPRVFAENAEGYAQLFGWLGDSADAVVGLEATGHYWKNLVATLLARGFAVVLLNPLRTRRFAEEEMLRAKTDAIDAKAIARFLLEKRPEPSRLPDEVTTTLRELVHLRDRLVQDLGDRVRQVHRALDLAFPEFTSFVSDLSTAKATTLLRSYPTASAFAKARVGAVANLKYDGRHSIGRELAQAIIERAKISVGAHQTEPFQWQVEFFCEDIDLLRERIARLDQRIETTLEHHEVAKLLTTIDGIGPNTAARIIATIGDPADFDSAKALAAYVGVAPGTRHSGKSRPSRARVTKLGASQLRRMLWMPTLRAVRSNPLIREQYERLQARGKRPKVAIIAAMRKLLAVVYSVARRRTPFVLHPPIPA